jgi:hypothetical protein
MIMPGQPAKAEPRDQSAEIEYGGGHLHELSETLFSGLQ